MLPTFQPFRYSANRSCLLARCVALVALASVSVVLAPVARAQTPDGDKDLRRVTPAGQAASRIALLIANADYPEAPLPNTLNDADDMAATLKSLGFTVTVGKDWNRRKIEEAIKKFGRDAQGSGIALFYFSGHGVQFEGKNYLVPVAHSIEKEADIPYEAVDAQRVLTEMQESGSGCNLLILDACRNRPRVAGDGKALFQEKGLAPMRGPIGTVIAYATAPGSTASVNTAGHNSLYTQELLKNLKTPNLRVGDVFMKTRAGVVKLSGGKQTPWEESSLTEDVVLLSKAEPKGNIKILETAARLSITVKPESATVTVDGEKALNNEFSIDLLGEQTKTVRVKVTAPGYKASLQEVPLTRGETTPLLVALAVAPAPTPVSNITTTARLAAQTLLAFVPGLLTDAKQSAQSVPTPLDKARALAFVANAQAVKGDVPEAKLTIARAKQIFAQVPPATDDTEAFARFYTLGAIARAQATTGDTTGTNQTLTGITNAPLKAVAFAAVAEAQALAGNTAEAKNSIAKAKQTAGSDANSILLGAIVQAQVAVGDVTGALQTNQGVTEPYWKALTLSLIAEAQGEAGNTASARQTIEKAKQTVESLTETEHLSYALASIAKAQAMIGDIDQALQTSEDITEADNKAILLAAIAEAQASAGDIETAKQTFQKAKQTAQSISGAGEKAQALSDIAETYAGKAKKLMKAKP